MVRLFKSFGLGIFLISSSAYSQGLEQIRAQHALPALSAGTLKNGVVEVNAVGIRALGHEALATNQDLWHIGSNGKALTAALGAVLVEQGFLKWTTTVADVFPEWPIHPAYKHVTLQELFAHRAGIHHDISAFAGGAYWKRFVESKEERNALREDFTRAVLTSAPETDGSKFHYSNSGYVVAAAMMTRLTGKSWEELMTNLVFNKLGMSSCGFGAAGKDSPRSPSQPWSHDDLLGTLTAISPADRGADNPQAIGPAGTMHCSMQHWLKFAQAHLDGFHGIDTPMLSAKGFEYLHKDYKGQGYTSGGLIYELRDGKTYLGHNGSNTMNFAILVLDTASRAAYVAATNRGHRNGEKGAQAAMLSLGSPDVCIRSHCLLTK